jgi:NitT/TauT family transport system substrate-binding protein
MLAALASQQIAGYIVAEPFNALAEAKGIGRILRFSGDVWKDHACCVNMMHDADIEQRPEWVQNVITALAQAAVELSRQGVQKYTPHEAEVLRSVLQPEPIIWGKYEKTGAIKHPQWQQHRLDFQPYPFESYSEMLIRLLQQTHVAGDHRFLEELDPAKAASTLFDTSFVKKALNTPELMQTFGIGTNFSRQEVFQL